MSSTSSFKIGIIGGTGFSSSDILKDANEISVDTIYGKPSDNLLCGKINGVDCVILSRHDKKHSTNPTNINYRANLLALKNAGCNVIVATTACGSLQENYTPGDLVVLSDFIDFTRQRKQTFYDGEQPDVFDKVRHVPMYPAFSTELRDILIKTSDSLDIKVHKTGTMITIEGPRFSSRAESKLFQKWDAQVINMTTCPEVILANELGIPYASLGLVTDYDCWRDVSAEGHVDVESVLSMFRLNLNKVVKLVTNAIPEIAKYNWQPILTASQEKVKNSAV